MSRPISVADEIALNALPVAMRAQLMALVSDAYYAGFDEAEGCAAADANGMDWLGVPLYRESAAALWLCANAVRFLGADVAIPLLAERAP